MASNTFKGFVYGAVAAASYGLNPLFTLPLYADGVSADSVLFYRYGLGVVMLALLMKVQKQSFDVLLYLQGGTQTSFRGWLSEL